MQNGFEADNRIDEEGRPAGGSATGVGISISWQNGPLGRVGSDERVEPNGAFVEDVIAIAKQRIEFYQTVADGRFACPENRRAIRALQVAIDQLESRTARRVAAQVEGTHEGR